MRIILNLTKNQQLVPFDYQSKLVGRLHKWLGKNEIHDGMSLYSFSWLGEGKAKDKKGLNFPNGTTWTINSHDVDFLKTIVQNVQIDNEVAFGIFVNGVTIQEDPYFGSEHTFRVASPVFIKQRIGEAQKFFYHNDAESGSLLTKTLQNKLRKAGLEDNGVNVSFVADYPNAITKMITYKGVQNKASICPVHIKGSPEQIAFAWNVGVGNLTGIGFGSLI